MGGQTSKRTGDPIDVWIDRISAGRSLIDIGGIGENSCNERISTALAAGASRAAIADIEPFSAPLWRVFRVHMSGTSGYDEYESVDVRDDLTKKLPPFDIVHCTGIIYHLPDPIIGVYNLSRLAQKWLIINTVTLPDRIENAEGKMVFEGSRALLLPAMSERERSILRLYYKDKFGWNLDDTAPRIDAARPIMPYVTDKGLSPWPYWWLFSKDTFRCAVKMMGFRIADEWVWEDHTLALLCERT